MEKNEYKNKMFEIADSVTMQDVLNRYGFRANRPSGRIPCPFHNGRDNNLGYSEKAFSCFVCGAKGNTISFVSLLFNESNGKAAQRIDQDFGLDMFGRRLSFAEYRKLERKRQSRLDDIKRKEERNQKYVNLCGLLHILESYIPTYALTHNDIDEKLASAIALKTETEARIEDLWKEIRTEYDN